MKKLIVFLMMIALLLCGCASNDDPQTPVSFYYLQSEFSFGSQNALCSPEIREAEGLSQTDVLQLYFSGPISETLKTPFPKNVTLIRMEQSGQHLSITLSPEYAQLVNLSLSLANLCVYKTCVALFEIETLEISAEGMQIDGADTIVLKPEDFVLYDQYASIPTE